MMRPAWTGWGSYLPFITLSEQQPFTPTRQQCIVTFFAPFVAIHHCPEYSVLGILKMPGRVRLSGVYAPPIEY